jgi:hypothetical protein
MGLRPEGPARIATRSVAGMGSRPQPGVLTPGTAPNPGTRPAGAQDSRAKIPEDNTFVSRNKPRR